MSNKKKRPTLQDVANLVGVTKMTVSRCLRDSSQVSEALRDKINAAVDELGYIPNRAPDILSNAKSNAIGVLVPSLTNQVFAEVIRGIEQVTAPAGYQTMIAHYGYSAELEEQSIASLLSYNVDAIILCTGYLHHFPFIGESLRLKATNRMWTEDLYQGVVWEDNPKMFYLGMQDQFYTFNMFDAQAWFARDVIMGRITIPSLADMKAHSQAWLAREATLETDEDLIWFQGDYVQELIDQTDYPSFDVEGVNQTFMQWEEHKHDDIMGFRNNGYKSLMTGTMAPKHHTPWLEALDDSMESYLSED